MVSNVVGAWGEAGARWLAELPRVLDEVTRDWGLTVESTYELSYHFVAAVTRGDGAPAVLKLGVPTGDALPGEVAALAAFGGCGAVRLLRADLARGAMLLERAEPGRRLRDLVPARDAEATAVTVDVIRRLAVPPPPGCPLPDLLTLHTAFDEHLALHGDAGPLPIELVTRAAGLMRELCASATDRVVLHGDLHHDNILRATREPWLAIDPHGVVGDRGYEVGAMLYNPEPDDADPALTALVPARVEQLADGLGIPLDRVVAWGFVQAVLSEVWTVQEWVPGTPWPGGGRVLDVARLLLPRLPG